MPCLTKTALLTYLGHHLSVYKLPQQFHDLCLQMLQLLARCTMEPQALSGVQCMFVEMIESIENMNMHVLHTLVPLYYQSLLYLLVTFLLLQVYNLHYSPMYNKNSMLNKNAM